MASPRKADSFELVKADVYQLEAAPMELDSFEAAPLAAAAPGGLIVAADKVAGVIEMLQNQIESLEQSTFPTQGAVAPGAFGQADRSPVLDQLHTAAHGAVMATVTDLLEDLLGFQQAVREATDLVQRKDEDTAVELTAILRRTEDLDMGNLVHVDPDDYSGGHPGSTPSSADAVPGTTPGRARTQPGPGAV